MMTMGSPLNPNVFTASQWEELEQQALIYKYMVSGVPVPSDLILSVRRSLYTNSSSSSSSSSSLASQNQPTFGAWEGRWFRAYNQIGGYGCKKIDLEPGRCRRTDGKKWRCSKEAYPDSKYCERHMHRGRNRSRKPVEFPISKSISHSDPSYPPFPSLLTDTDSSSYTLKDYSNLQGMKDLGEDDQRSAAAAAAYFKLNDPTTQKMSSTHHHHLNFQNQQKKEEETHCFVMGTTNPSAAEEEASSKSIKQQPPFHHFFSPPNPPNWPPKDPNLDLFQSKPARPYW